MQVIVIASAKGGTGKTTTAVNLGAVLADEMGRPTLLIDLDPQGGASVHLDATVGRGEPTIVEILRDKKWEESLRSTVVEGLYVAASSPKLATLVARGQIPATRLRIRLQALPPEQYEHVLIDCPPGLGQLVVVALAAATLGLVPVECRPLAYQGLTGMLEFADSVRAEWNRELTRSRVLILPTRLDRRTSISKSVLEALQLEHGGRVLPAIPENVALSMASAYRKPIILHAPSAAGAVAYRQLARAIVKQDHSQ